MQRFGFWLSVWGISFSNHVDLIVVLLVGVNLLFLGGLAMQIYSRVTDASIQMFSFV